MIKTLVLSKFGKFTNQIFEFGAITVFHGNNETGKTTLFDSIYSSLFKIQGQSADKKEFNRRYGDTYSAKLIDANNLEIEKDIISFGEFRSLFSIRAGDVSFDLGSEAKKKDAWIDELKASLLSGGIDLNSIKKELEKITSTHKGSNRVLTGLEERKEDVIKNLQEAKRKREAQIQQEDTLHQNEIEIAEIKKKIADQEKQIANFEQKISDQEKIRERVILAKQMLVFSEIKNTEEYLQKSRVLEKVNLAELDELSQKKEEFNRLLTSNQSEKEALEGNLAELKNNLSHFESLRERKKNVNEMAAQLKKEVGDYLNENISATQKLHLVGVISFVTLSLVCITLGFIFEFVIAYVVAAMSFVAAMYLLIFGKKRGTDEAELIRQHRIAWKMKVGESLDEFDTALGLRDYYTKIENDWNALEESIRSEYEKIKKISSLLENKKSDLDELNSKYYSFEQKIKDWLRDFDAKNRDELILKINEFKNAKALLEELKKTENLNWNEELKIEIERKLKILDEEHIPATGLDQATFKLLVHKEKELREQIGINKEILKNKEIVFGKEESGIRAISDPLMNSIHQLEKERMKTQLEIDEIYQKKNGARLAIDILNTINEDMEKVLEDLSAEIAQEITYIIGNRKVKIEKLHHENFILEDAQGLMRDMDLLSNGTKDIFMFIMKLAFIRKNNRKMKLILLDEPFLSLDRNRQIKCLEYIKTFQLENEFQIVFLTKENELKEDICSLFENAMVHELT